MTSFFHNDFKKIENYKKKFFFNKKQAIINTVNLTCYIKKIKRKKGRKIFSDIFFIFKRLESFSSFLPKIYKLSLLKHGKKNLKTKGLILIKLFLNYQNSINFINFIFIKHFYFYLHFLFNLKHKYLYFEEIMRPIFKKNIFLNKKTLMLKFNLYKRWIDMSRKFIKFNKNFEKIRFTKYKTKKKNIKAVKTLKFIKTRIIFKSSFIKYFYNFISMLIKNFYKIILYIYKKFRKNKLKI